MLTSINAGKASVSIPDDEVMRFASADQRAVLTHNRQDFIRSDSLQGLLLRVNRSG